MNPEFRNFADVTMLRKPVVTFAESAGNFIKLIQEKYNVRIDNYWDLHNWSINNIPEMWAELWDFIGIKCSQRFDSVVDLSTPLCDRPKWFEGAKFNFTENLLRYTDDKIALIITGEKKSTTYVTHGELFENVSLYAAAFRKCGIQKGDVIVGFISNREEPLYAALAAASIGAIWCGILPFLGTKSAVEKLKLITPKLLLTIDRFLYNGEVIEMLPKVKEIAKEVEALEKILFVTPTNQAEAESLKEIRNSCNLQDFLKLGFEEDGSVPKPQFEQASFSDPVFLAFTSGSTGQPKVLVHGCGPLFSTAKSCVMRTVSRNTRILMSTTPGWISWQRLISHLFSGISLVLYDGLPFHLSSTHIWDVIDEHKVSHIFLTPNILDKMEKDNCVPTTKHSLDSLKAIICGGSVTKPQNFDFVDNNIGKGIFLSSVYGSTEISSLGTYDVTLPIYKGEITCPALGISIQCVNESGQPVFGELGEVVLTTPTPYFPLGLWGDADGSKYKEAYFPKYSDKFSMMDMGIINPITKGLIICCRSDETLQSNILRYGSSEIYNTVNKLDEIYDCLCVSRSNKDEGEKVVLFVKMKEHIQFDENLQEKIRTTIKEDLSSLCIPDLILETKDIPYNLNGKKMEIVVKKIINNMPCCDDTVINKESLEYFRNLRFDF